jgi:hypothetical protein
MADSVLYIVDRACVLLSSVKFIKCFKYRVIYISVYVIHV